MSSPDAPETLYEPGFQGGPHLYGWAAWLVSGRLSSHSVACPGRHRFMFFSVRSVVMIFVINKRSFGWTLQMELGGAVFIQAVTLAVVGALVAGLYPAWRMARTSPAVALRGE